MMHVTMMTLLSGCMTSTIAINDYCLLYKPVTFSAKNDTVETVDQIDNNNVVYERVCNGS